MSQLRYISLQEFINEIPHQMQGLITDDNPNSSVAKNPILKQKALAAEAEFESYIVARYKIPVRATDGTVPEKVRQTIYTILKYHMYARRNALTDSINRQYNDTIKWLEMVANGKANIPHIDGDGTVETTGVGRVVTGGYKQRSTFDGFV